MAVHVTLVSGEREIHAENHFILYSAFRKKMHFNIYYLIPFVWGFFPENLRDVRITDNPSRKSSRYSYNFTPSRGGDVTDMSGLKKKLQQIEDE